MAIPKDIILRILETADIVDIIGEYVRLSRRGVNFVGLCPFHNEKTPSFTVSPSKNIYKCFGCGKGGNAINFLMDYNNLTYTEAIKDLAKKYNINIPDTASQKKDYDKIDLMYSSLIDTAKFFHNKLYEKDGADTLSYFKRRMFDENTIATFLLGYAPDNFNELINHLKKSNYPQNIFINNGIAYLSEKKEQLIPRFRNRAIFPIRDFIGRVIGFGARYMGNEPNQAKYINSPQNEIYDKSRVLYGIFEAKNEIRNKDYAILVEGYTDVISLFQAGIKNAVATSGTALTAQQLKLLSRFTNNLYICYDGDETGQKATESAAELALINGFDVKIIVLPDTEDPDSFIKKNSKEKFERYISNAKSYIKYKIERLKNKNLLDTPKAQSNAIKSIIQVIYRIPDELQHDFYITQLAQELNLTETQIKKIKDLKTSVIESIEKEINNNYNENILENKSNANNEERFDLQEMFPEERLLAKVILNSSDNFLHLFEYTDFSYDMLLSKTARKIFEIMANYSDNTNILSEILNSELNENIKNIFIDLSIEKETPSENWEAMLNYELNAPDYIKIIKDCVIKLEIRRIENHIKELKKLIIKEKDNEIHIQRLNELLKKLSLIKKN